MKRGFCILAACLLSGLASPPVGVAQEQREGTAPTYPRAELSKAFAPTLGDMIAQSMTNLIVATRSATDAPTIVIYDRDAKKIAVFIYGSRTTLDGAKKGIDTVRAQMRNSVAFIEALYHASLDEADLTFSYYHDGKNLIGWQDGKYTVGGE